MMERYSRSDFAVLMYHLHIPMPDPMTNPSTEARARFYEARGTPAFAFDGQLAMGGGSRDEAKEYYGKLNRQVEKRLETPAEARLALDASLDGAVVRVKASVGEITNRSPNLKLQIALVEEALTYSGEGGLRFHPMVVRSLGGEKAEGFGLSRSGETTVEHAFDLAKISLEIKKHLEDTEKARKMKFGGRMDEIDKKALSVAAFVQDSKTRQVLQATLIKVHQ